MKNPNRLWKSLQWCVLVLGAGLFLVSTAAFAQPNIIFILADDLGWTDTGTYGSQYYETPNMDRLAAQGMKLTAFHCSQNCAPSRAALMSGQYSPRTGVYMVGNAEKKGGDWESRPLAVQPVTNQQFLGLDKITIAQSLKNAGYATAAFGKWHLGNYEKNPQFHPGNRGFDEAVVSEGGHYNFKTSPEIAHSQNDYLADWLTDQSLAFIAKNSDRPFFLYLPHFGVHAPFQAKPELIEKYRAKASAGGHSNPVYAAMIESVDQSVGRILDLLEELKIDQNTVVIFSSDNGGVGGYDAPNGLFRMEAQAAKAADADSEDNGNQVTNNAPLRSGKGSPYEGGTRVPFIVRWPGKIKAGSVSPVPAVHVDLYPTLLEIAGATPPSNYPLDGVSLVPLFQGKRVKRDKGIFLHFPGYLGAGTGQWRGVPVSTITSGRWKLLEFLEDQSLELYDLDADPGETTNLAASRPGKASVLQAWLHQWQTDIQAPMPARKTVK